VGVLDADLRSPTVARMLAAVGPLQITAQGVEPALGRDGVKVVSTDLLLDEGRPLGWREPTAERFVWRGVLEAGALREFLSDVVWGPLDLLLVDLPPGADGVIDLHALVPALTGALVVTIPSDESGRSVGRTMRSATEAGIPLLGVIENMSGYRCADCAGTGRLFTGDAGGRLAEEFGVPLLARLPFDAAATALPPDAVDAMLRVLR
jgi:ATP-binding protein involved in chromosome partitioning